MSLVTRLLALGPSRPPPTLAAAGVRSASDAATGASRLARGIGLDGHRLAGEVRTQGSLDVPLDSSSFGGIARLLGEHSDLRVWWRDADTWRIDRLRTTGESDIARNGGLSVRWSYEEGRARFAAYSPIRLPDDNDIVPPALAARLLDGARGDELSRLPARRVAGRSAAGLRLVPANPASTIARVDVWADESSGLPLRVEVYGEDDTAHPTLTSEITRLDLGDPTNSEVGFRLSPGVNGRPWLDTGRRRPGERVRAVPAAHEGDRAGSPRRAGRPGRRGRLRPRTDSAAGAATA